MSLKIYNTISRTIDEFIPGGILKKTNSDYPAVTIYSCGPTVHNYAHIGNFRTFIFNDFLRRYLKFRNFKVNHAMNITDVDDKTINGANENNQTLKEYTDKYTEIFLEDLKTLNIEPVEHLPKATESIDEIIDLITNLKKKDLIYEKDNSIYFSITKYEKYGKLSNLENRDIKSGLRYDTDEYDKEDIRDFALWKKSKEDEISWETPFGDGRPGWHIECSAMIRKIFNSTIDIHTGGVDLIFPHHENEMAQSEAAYDEQFVRYWIHAEHLLVGGKKMSKSLGNFYTLKDLLDKGYSPRSIRYLLISSHYRKQLNFTLNGLKQTDQALQRIDNFIFRLNEIKTNIQKNNDSNITIICEKFLSNFATSVDNDLNISKGFGTLFDFIHNINSLIDSNNVSLDDKDIIIQTLEKIDSVIGIIFFNKKANLDDNDESRINELIKERDNAKKNKDYAKSDEIRDLLKNEGIILEDSKEGTRWKKI